MLEERIGGVAKASYVWSPVYVDAMVARDRDADGLSGNGREERLYALADANYNVTALVGVDGTVKERYEYNAFGITIVFNSTYSVRTGGSIYGWTNQWQGMFYEMVSASYKSRMRTDISPMLGSAIQIDPLGLRPDVNAYRWEGNGPTNRVDPSGLFPHAAIPDHYTIPVPFLLAQKQERPV